MVAPVSPQSRALGTEQKTKGGFVVRAVLGNLPSFPAVPGSNFLFEPTRCDGGAEFGSRAPRGSTRRYVLP